ncbi:MAG TPA: rod shape-determining protein MreC [Kiloniellales bacterium]|nr:rod shape-determining protein MreC [Kiloniellales bacterium]
MRLATPLKAWAQRFLFLLLVAAAFALMLLGKADIALIDRARTAVQDGLAPLLDGLSKPIATVNGLIDYASELASLQAENEALRQKNQELLAWEAIARETAAENERLRALLNFVPDAAVGHRSARVIGDQGGAFVRSILVAAGTLDGVRRGQAAMTGEGMVGRVVSVGKRSARVLLLTDLNSRVPVLVGEARHRAMLVGDNSALPDLMYLDDGARLAVGDYVVTSGIGGVFPQGLPIGRVAAVEDGVAEVAPFVDWAHLEVIRLVDYGLPGLIEEDGEASEGIPTP